VLTLGINTPDFGSFPQVPSEIERLPQDGNFF
jgi:hypothetical protein